MVSASKAFLVNATLSRRWAVALGACLLLVVWDVWLRAPSLPQPRAVWPEPMLASDAALVLQAQGHMPMPAGVPAAHASTLLPLPSDEAAALEAYWFAGSRESGPDVHIVMSEFVRATQQWSPARDVVNRHHAGAELGFGLRRLGNPVAWRDAAGRTHLFVVATGLGGWAAGRVLHLRQDAPRHAFRALRVLPLSWLWNTSHLVRAMPLPLADGGSISAHWFALEGDAFGDSVWEASASSGHTDSVAYGDPVVLGGALASLGAFAAPARGR